jgi:hypothetical protein
VLRLQGQHAPLGARKWSPACRAAAVRRMMCLYFSVSLCQQRVAGSAWSWLAWTASAVPLRQLEAGRSSSALPHLPATVKHSSLQRSRKCTAGCQAIPRALAELLRTLATCLERNQPEAGVGAGRLLGWRWCSVVVCGLVWLSWACGVACFILARLWQNKATRTLCQALSLVLFIALLG